MSVVENKDAVQEAAPAETPAAGEPPAGTTPAPYEGLPDSFQWMVKELETTRREAAAARVAARETADKYKDAKTPEDYESLRVELIARAEAAERAAQVAAAARRHSLPEDLTDFLTGATPEEIEAQAAKLAALSVPPPVQVVNVTKLPPTGGTTPGDAAEPNGREVYRAWKKRQ